jgi:hypothetical protein
MEIEGRIFPTKLAVFGMLGFDVILGIDWLAKYDASINCPRKLLSDLMAWMSFDKCRMLHIQAP